MSDTQAMVDAGQVGDEDRTQQEVGRHSHAHQ